MVASTRSNSVHILAVQQEALTFLQISYPWLHAEDIFQNIDEITTLLQQIKDLNITQAAQADTMTEELFLEWEEFPPLPEDDYSQSNPNRGGWNNDSSLLTSQAHRTSHSPSSRVSTHRAPLKKKAQSRTSEAFSDCDLSNSAESYSTRRSCHHSAKQNNTTSVLTPITTLAVQQVHLQEACQRPPTTQLPTMTSVITVTTDQSSLTSTIGDQLIMIQRQSSELEELKISLQFICQEMGQYQATQLNMIQNVQALHSTAQEMAQSMPSMMSNLDQFTFPAALPPPPITHTPQESTYQASEASLGWQPP
jgi:hypothetical protein